MNNRIEVFKQMIEADPSNTMVLFGLANEYQKLQDWPNVIDALGKYLAAADDEGAAYGMLAKAYDNLGDFENARKALEKGIETALAHGHPTMANDFKMTLDLEYGS